MDVVIANRTTDPSEICALQKLSNSAADSTEIFGTLNPGEASILSSDGDAGGRLRRFTLLTRLTAHVRHRCKYIDIPVAPGRGFVFTQNGNPLRAPCMTLLEFVSALQNIPEAALAQHAGRGDFSHWIADVFRDYPLASDIRKIEQRYRVGDIGKLGNEIRNAIQARYDIAPEMVL